LPTVVEDSFEGEEGESYKDYGTMNLHEIELQAIEKQESYDSF